MKPPPDVSESLSLTMGESMLLGVSVLLTLAVATYLLVFFIRQQRRETRKERGR
ncbi:MAG: hypothetical protein QGI75_04320 [Phycisphaerales bacterium]|jgi:hypothetical protein|nr:hypothetical protein [Phycisphaerales bacterium]MDP6889724.1 hypothetical protein [Phycisphaerales bacterium]